jgi:hypothetical protein
MMTSEQCVAFAEGKVAVTTKEIAKHEKTVAKALKDTPREVGLLREYTATQTMHPCAYDDATPSKLCLDL